MRALAARVAGALSLWLCAALACADADRVLVLATSDSSLARRLLAELSVLGFEPVLTPVEGPLGLDEMAALARNEGAGVAIWIARTPGGAQVSLVDRVTGKALQREVALELDEPERDGAIALSAVELLRASLLELAAAHPGRGELAPTRTYAALATPRPARFALDLGFALSGTPRAPAPFMQLRLGAYARVQRWLQIALDALVPLRPLRLSSDEGSAQLWSSSLALSARVPLARERARFEPYAGIGGLGIFAVAYGRANPPYEGDTRRGFTGGPALELGGRLMIRKNLGLRCDLLAALAVSELAVRFGRDVLARFGKPLLLGSFGIDVLF